jgi:hypothetical protein
MLKDLKLNPTELASAGRILNDALNKEPNAGMALKLLEQLYHTRPSYIPGDPHGTAFQEGQRDVYLTILSLIGYFQQHQKEE